ncbi:MAG: ATP-binding cassette domain-containing protein [Candidatus Wallbacteria bacterium]
MLEIKNISKTFNKNTPDMVKALTDVSLTIEEGSFTIFLGTNGSGKSTLLNAVAGTFFVDSGKITLAGVDITNLAEHSRAEFIGRVFQNPFSGTAADMSIAENLALAIRRGKTRNFRMLLSKENVDFLKERVRVLNMGLEDRLDNKIGGLSGGQRQALTLLMATLVKPKLLLLDEHTAALDPKTANKVIALSKEIIEKDNLTTLMVTHSMQQAINLGDRIVMLYNGKIIHDFKGEEKKRLKVSDLFELFEDIRRREQIDSEVAEMLKASYI